MSDQILTMTKMKPSKYGSIGRNVIPHETRNEPSWDDFFEVWNGRQERFLEGESDDIRNVVSFTKKVDSGLPDSDWVVQHPRYVRLMHSRAIAEKQLMTVDAIKTEARATSTDLRLSVSVIHVGFYMTAIFSALMILGAISRSQLVVPLVGWVGIIIGVTFMLMGRSTGKEISSESR